jgi:hypothetical protein
MIQKVVTAPCSGVLFLIFGLSQLFMSPLLADELMNITDIKDCQRISGDAERLACYDTVSRGEIFNEQQLKQVQIEQFGSNKMTKQSEPEPPAAKESATATAADTTAKPESAPLPQTKISVDEIPVTVVRVQKDGVGIHYFQTSDGQVWKQQNATSWNLTVPFDAKIEKGLMGSFFLVNEGGKSTRVKRVK